MKRLGGTGALLTVTGLAGLLAVHAIIRENAPPPFAEHPVFGLQLLDVSTALSLLIGLTTLTIVRHQFALNTRPYLAYTTGYGSPGNLGSRGEGNRAADDGVYLVTVNNAGGGVAIVETVRYSVEFADGARGAGLTHEQLKRRLEAVSLVSHEDFFVANLGPAAPLAAGRDFRICELSKSTALDRIRDLRVDVSFQSLVGDSYEKTIRCTPPVAAGDAASDA